MPKDLANSLRLTLADNLRWIRADRKISQEALADLAGLDRTYLSGIERSKRNVGIDNIQRLANALNVRPSSLLEKRD